MTKATLIVHWATGPVYCCPKHGQGLNNIAQAMGIHAHVEPYSGDELCNSCSRAMGEFQKYRHTNIAEMREYIPGESLDGISVSAEDDPPNDNGMIARNPANHKDQWYVARAYFNANFEPADD